MPKHHVASILTSLGDERAGVVNRQILRDAGLTKHDIRDAIEEGSIVAALRGIYLVGRSRLTPEALKHAAVLHADPAMIIGRSAAEHRGLLDARKGVIALASGRAKQNRVVKTLVPMAGGRARGLISLRPTTVLTPELVHGLPTATVPRMLVEIAAAERRSMLNRVWKQADYHRILDLDAVHQEISRSRREGVPLVRALFEKHPGRFGVKAFYESPSEIDFLQLIIEAGLPIPEVNVPMRIAGRRYVGDFFWVELGLVAELDDPSHDRQLAQQSDALRDADFFDADLDVVRFDTRNVAADPVANMRRLGAAIARQRRRIARRG